MLERELGRGGMATVYLAQDLKHDRPVALKVLRPELAATLGPERFLREIRFAARLQHPHIVSVHDSGEAAGQLWFTMPYVEGESLRTRLTREGQLPIEAALRITREAAQALEYAHEHGVIHRDIKPENLLLTTDGNTLVADFGIARAFGGVGGEGRLTETGLSLGTPRYMSPEQAAGERGLDRRSDLYSLGCVLYEMLAGEPPFTGPSAQAILAKQFSEPLPHLRVLRPAVPEAVEQAIRRALARSPADRFATARHFAAALTTAVAPEGAPTATTRMIYPRSWSRIRAAMLAALVLLGFVGVWVVWKRLSVPAAPVSPTRLAVLPFSVPGSPGLSYLSEGMVDLLSRNLNSAGDLRTIDPGTVVTTVGKTGIRTPDQKYGRTLANRLGAGLYVLGSVHAIGSRLRIQASLHDTRDTLAESLSSASVEGDTGQLFELVDRLSGQLLASRRLGQGFSLVQTAVLTTQSLPALRAYLDGERNLRAGEGQFDSAIAGFQHAVAQDSTFALGYYRLAVSAGWAGRPGISGPATEKALTYGDRLGDRDRRLLVAFAAFRRGAADAAEKQYRVILRDYPDDLEAEFQLADLLYHYNAPRGRPIAEAQEPFDRLLAVDPQFLCPI